MALRLVMMGTGTFALPTFLALYGSPHAVVGLFTQPDRAGRGHHHHPHPMKDAALERGTPVFQPENVNLPQSLADLRALDPDLCVVAAYGQILSPELLSVPRRGAINLHASILPKHRGAAPVQYAVWTGDRETGVTIFQIEPKLDAGPTLGLATTPIGSRETAGDLEDRLAALAAPLALDVIGRIAAGTAQSVPQPAGQATRAPRLKKEHGRIDWRKSPEEIDWHVRAMQPWPNPFTWLHRAGHAPQRMLVLRVSPTEAPPVAPETIGESRPEPGTVVFADRQSVLAATGRGLVSIDVVRPDGKRAMGIAEFLRGHPVSSGDRFGPETPE